MVAGRLSYYIYIVTGLVFLSAAWRTAQRSLAQPEGAAGVLARLTSLWETATRIAAEVWARPWSCPPACYSGFAIAYALTLVVEARMSGHFSGFWLVKQEELRDGLKQARLDLKAAQQQCRHQRQEDLTTRSW